MNITVPKHRWKQFAQLERLRDLPRGYWQLLGKPYNGVGFCDHTHNDFAFSRETHVGNSLWLLLSFVLRQDVLRSRYAPGRERPHSAVREKNVSTLQLGCLLFRNHSALICVFLLKHRDTLVPWCLNEISVVTGWPHGTATSAPWSAMQVVRTPAPMGA